MKRRGFLAALAAVPFLGRMVEAAPVGHETYAVRYFDDVRPYIAVADPFMPALAIDCIQGVMCIPLGLARRMPKRDSFVTLNGAKFAGWKLS